MSGCTCNWNATFPAPRCPVHNPPVCTCARCPCCGGVQAAPYQIQPQTWPMDTCRYRGYGWTWTDTGTSSWTITTS